MGPQLISKAVEVIFMPVYRCQDFYCGQAGGCTGFTRGSTRGPRGPKKERQKGGGHYRARGGGVGHHELLIYCSR